MAGPKCWTSKPNCGANLLGQSSTLTGSLAPFRSSNAPTRTSLTTYYYRWELLTKHLTYGSPNSGYSFTEFIDRPFWSGAYGAISCPAGHQIYEARWLRSPRIATDYCNYGCDTPGAQPRNYSTWLADSVWATHLVYPNQAWTVDLLPDLVKNFEGWEKRHYVQRLGLFWQTAMMMEWSSTSTADRHKIFCAELPVIAPHSMPTCGPTRKRSLPSLGMANEAEIAKRFTDKAISSKPKCLN